MKHRLHQLEFGASCLGDIRVLLRVWLGVLVLEALEGSPAKLKELSDKPIELSDVMEKIEAAQGLLQKVEENYFSKVLAKNRLSTASIMKKIRSA